MWLCVWEYKRTPRVGVGSPWVFPTYNLDHEGIFSMPDLNFIRIFDQNDVFDHFLIFTPFLLLFFAIY